MLKIKIKIYFTKVALLMIIMKDMEDQFIMMEAIMKDNLQMVREKDLENMFGKIAMPILVNGSEMHSMDLENFIKAMNIMKGNSKKINKKEMDNTFIMMGQYIKVNGIKIKNMEKAN